MSDKKRVPKVRIARPIGRCFQLRYHCPELGKEIRIGTGTRDEEDAQQLKAELEAKLLLGLPIERKTGAVRGPQMGWDVFREEYRNIRLKSLRKKSAQDAESRLDIAEKIVQPRTLGDMAKPDVLLRLQADLEAGIHGRRKRSLHTVKGHMKSILAALNWAKEMTWLENVPTIRLVKTAKLKAMKGRPVTSEEFQRILDATAGVVGEAAAESWQYVLRGLWTSALRVGEIMDVSWDNPNCIHPIWEFGKLPTLAIPHDKQKNATEEEIPLLPWFETVLHETPEELRTGWVFNPNSLQAKVGRKRCDTRLTVERVSRIISRIGKAAEVVVDPGNEETGRQRKYASAHDLRRGCAVRLRESGLAPIQITRVLRHASWETTLKHYAEADVQSDANAIRQQLSEVEKESR